jgi:hypothetical protein
MFEGVDFFGKLCPEGATASERGVSKRTFRRQLLKYTDAKIASLRRTNSVVRNLFPSELIQVLTK